MDTPSPLTHHTPAAGTVLGRLDALADGSATMGELPAPDALTHKPFRYLLLRSGDTVKAYENRCAHFGVPLAARQDLLIFQPHASISCNVHYARYRWSDGVCESGDCVGEALPAIAVQLDAQGNICMVGDGPAP
ncbi:Rieske 2Fe-2S domain-containing protein [Rhodoferax saidenbachensis]|uniref:Nitrite reductase/ring-hydroxylating ferredoxin subunit n=1 Tax=Rhodoferax saidenbachensis TaxID=1484693 RepID=A0ABU1ZS54_9BURK|nr:Rieske 2Fe-2S domain-containing protein [Rhodoferax saidenbachensis]MDR7308382.1 nitrite reductase/ring-hydroxylating ferredoxin subunit [Rhodoferax saidenbachensis]